MGTLNCRHKLKTHIKSKIKITFKMHGFQPHNMFHMVNTMMNDPEFKNLAKNFQEQMKNSMEEFQKSQTKETQKPTESSCSEQKTQNSSACPMFKMCNPRKNNQKSKPNSVSIPLRRFAPEQVQLNMNKNGLVTVTASRENTEESNRNGQRKTTIMIEETCQLPGYLVDNDLLKTVESKFHDGFLVLSYAEDPKIVKDREAEERKNAPIEIPIMMED